MIIIEKKRKSELNPAIQICKQMQKNYLLSAVCRIGSTASMSKKTVFYESWLKDSDYSAWLGKHASKHKA